MSELVTPNRINTFLDTLRAENRLATYKATNIDRFTIDDNIITGYGAFRFTWYKTYLEAPTRSESGQIVDLNSQHAVLTPVLSVDFSLISIDMYRKLMQLFLGKNEYVVACYDPIYDEENSFKMYIAENQLDKLYTIAHPNGDVELLGVQDYTLELIGTNVDVEEKTITYYLNLPADSGIDVEPDTDIITQQVVTKDGLITTIGKDVKAQIADYNGGTEFTMSECSFNGYYFLNWNTKSDGSGTGYRDMSEYQIPTDLTLYANWVATDSYSSIADYLNGSY